jgi:phage-related minor tail protein
MQVNPIDPSGITPSSSGTSELKSDPSAAPVNGTVAYESYQKLLGEKKARDRELEAARKALADREAADREAETKRLQEQNEFKKLYEAEKARAEKADLELKEHTEQVQAHRKLSAFLDAIEGKLDRKYWTLIDLDNIKVDPATGLPDETSVAQAAKVFSVDHSRLIDKGDPLSLPNDAARGASNKKLKYEDWVKLPIAEKKKRFGELDPNE